MIGSRLIDRDHYRLELLPGRLIRVSNALAHISEQRDQVSLPVFLLSHSLLRDIRPEISLQKYDKND
jgi:hypothetical protein